MKKRDYCPRCGGNLTRARKNVSAGYFAACLSCDEDFYSIELTKQKRRKK